jgi:uncharacterized membrane protein (DUF2068 family)
MSDRPLLISIIAGSDILIGVIMILTGFGVIALPSLLNSLGASIQLWPVQLLDIASESVISVAAYFAGGILVFCGIVILVMGYGLWTFQKWAWYVQMGSYIIGLIFNLYGIVGNSFWSVVGIVWTGFLLWYFWNKRDLFGVVVDI